jgi:2-keto-4-pentenoate hydratase/2-oxohepta-3-ene-1,7-dioic acid hydratase in catechol pathway
MKLCRFQPLEFAAKHAGRSAGEAHAESRAGILEGDLIREISGELWGSREPVGRNWRAKDVKFLPPSAPTKIVCVGKNYLDHVSEMGGVAPPKEPLIFLKPPSSIIAPEESIVLPPSSHRVDYEGELAVVMARRCSRLGADQDPRPYIAGYTCLNDVTARDIQKSDVQFTRGKGFDTFCPFGPVLETDRPAGSALVETFVNGVNKQSGRVEEMIFPMDFVLRFITQVMTLEPGDVISTGTPSGVGPLAAGDVVEVRVGGIGTLRNTVVALTQS